MKKLVKTLEFCVECDQQEGLTPNFSPEVCIMFCSGTKSIIAITNHEEKYKITPSENCPPEDYKDKL